MATLFSTAQAASPPAPLSAYAAPNWPGASVVVTARVAQVEMLGPGVRLDLEERRPGQPLTLIIPAALTNQFGDLAAFLDAPIEARGTVTNIEGRAQIVIEQTNRLKRFANTNVPASRPSAPGRLRVLLE